jgi:catechol 2,3-dioxygenase-like lactoylglutathione lyase family enzyme
MQFVLALLENAEEDMAEFEVTQIDHVSVITSDLERSRRFYRDLLGLKEIAKPRTFDFVVLWFDLGNQQLHLLLQERPDGRSPRHFALRVKDTQSARTYFRRNGIPVEETTLIPGADRFFIYDPDGNRIEIIRWLEPYDPAVSGAKELDRAGLGRIGRVTDV